jgi:hypothetical protein
VVEVLTPVKDLFGYSTVNRKRSNFFGGIPFVISTGLG